jgi:hypothetical protein
MHWGAYEIFSVLSGVSILGLATFNGKEKPMQRVWIACAGIFFVAYGIFVANQAAGYYVFPVEIFIIPGGLLLLGLFALFARSSSTSGWRTWMTSQPRVNAPPSRESARADSDERTSTQPGDW